MLADDSRADLHDGIPSADLRTAALAKRDALSGEQRAAAARAMTKRGLPFARTRHGHFRVFADPQRDRPALMQLAEQGASWRCRRRGAGRRRLRAWSPDDRLMLGPLGILEPSPAAAELIPDIMLVPLAAFDRQGHRIGYGAGHYDFTLAHLRKVKAITAIGTAFAVQEIKAVPALPHDVALDYVLTEKRVFDFRS